MPATTTDTASEPIQEEVPPPGAAPGRHWRAMFSRIFQTVILVLAFAVVLLAVLPPLLGYRGLVVLSGSMEPALQVGDVSYIKAVNPATLGVGDIVTFPSKRLPDVFVTHRVIDVQGAGGERRLITKGDNNPAIDTDPVLPSEVTGTYRFSVPKLGTVLSGLRDRTTYVVVAGLLFALVLAYEVPIIRRDLAASRRKKLGAVVPAADTASEVGDVPAREMTVAPAQAAAVPVRVPPQLAREREGAMHGGVLWPPRS